MLFTLYSMDFFLGQPSSIFNRLLDVFSLKVRGVAVFSWQVGEVG
jgi:hypothetical protein